MSHWSRVREGEELSAIALYHTTDGTCGRLPALFYRHEPYMSDDASGLKRDLGLLEATTIIMGTMIGSGIFLAPALIAAIIVAENLGPGSFILIWVIGGVLTLCGALSYSELAAAFPRAGG